MSDDAKTDTDEMDARALAAHRRGFEYAFPRTSNTCPSGESAWDSSDGMSIREHAAIEIMKSLVGNPAVWTSMADREDIAREAVALAEALLLVLEQSRA